MDSFIKQYQYKSDMAPDRVQLQNMCKRYIESVKECAQRWRDLVAQVVPLMTKTEMITMIMDALPVFYYEKKVGCMSSNFVDLVFVGEMIEVGLRKGNFDYAASTNSSNRRPAMSGGKKKEGEAHVVTTVPTWPKFPLAFYNPIYQYPPQQCHYSANINSTHYPPPYLYIMKCLWMQQAPILLITLIINLISLAQHFQDKLLRSRDASTLLFNSHVSSSSITLIEELPLFASRLVRTLGLSS